MIGLVWLARLLPWILRLVPIVVAAFAAKAALGELDGGHWLLDQLPNHTPIAFPDLALLRTLFLGLGVANRFVDLPAIMLTTGMIAAWEGSLLLWWVLKKIFEVVGRAVAAALRGMGWRF